MAQGGPQPQGKSRRGWRGAQSAERAPAKYNWQRDASDRPATSARRPGHGARWRLAAYALTAAALLTVFVRTLLFVPPKTPFVLVTPSVVAPYEAPLPPDAWVAEDVERFRQLDDASSLAAGTLLVHDTSRDWHSVVQGLEGLRRQLRELAQRNDHNDAVVIYVSMHGAVNDVGMPCLILPACQGLSELETGSWVPVATLLETVAAAGFRDDVVKLVVLDSGRFRVNWGLGTLYNTFSEKIREVVEASETPNLVVFNATSPGELAWASPELQGSVFAHYLQRGISGEADDGVSGGNSDRQVSVGELSTYVTRQVSDWVWHNRGEDQHPVMLAARTIPHEATVAWALRPAERRRLPAAAELPSIATPPEIEGYWQQYARLKDGGAASIDPLNWSRLQHSLVRLEHCLGAGRAYTSAARDSRASVLNALHQLEELASSGEGQEESGGECLIGARRHDLDVLHLIPCHSLPLASALGAVAERELNSVNAALDALVAAEARPPLAETVSHLATLPAAQGLVEVHFVRLLQQYRIEDRYSQPEAIAAALNLRRWAERAATPCDERLLRLAGTELDEADNARRVLEDGLFAGLPFSVADWTAAQQRYQQLFERQSQLAADLEWRDRTLSELPWLAQWLTRVSLGAGTQEQEELDGEIADNLRSIIQAVCRTTAEEFLEQRSTDQLRQDYHTLRVRISDEYERLLTATVVDGGNVRDALVLLDLPLLPEVEDGEVRRTAAEPRAALRTLVSRWSSQLAAGPPATNEPRASTVDAERGSRFLARMESGWRYHPASAMFGEAEMDADAAPEQDLTARLVARESRLRQSLATLPDRLKAIHNVTFDSLDEARAAWSEGERQTRVLAPLMSASLDVDAPLELRKLDLEQLLIWHAGRALEDFYGLADAQARPFFVAAVTDCLSAAKALSDGQSIFGDQLESAAALLEQRRNLVQPATGQPLLVSRVSDVVIVDERTPAFTTVSVSPLDATAGPALPQGVAALYVDAVSGEPGPAVTVAVPLSESVQHAVPIVASAMHRWGGDAAQTHAAILSFRGHEFASPFEIAELAGTMSRWTPDAADSAEVLVIGPQQRAPDVVFVLDCSASMQQPLDLEAGATRRFDAALRALRPMLEDLARQGTMRIGFVLFGHRARWDQNEVVRQTGYSRSIAPNQMPFDDVETILPIGRFDPTIAGQLFGTLQSATPWGESPLFLALIQALRQLPETDDARSQNIIVVTDGLNSQFNAPRDKRKYLPDVLQQLDQRPVPIHVVGFGVPPADAVEAQQAYQQLAERSGGSYAPIEEAAELVEYLRGLITRESYAVQDGGEFLATTTIGSPQRIDRLAQRRQPFAVTTGNTGASFTAEGGEALRLQLSADGARLSVAPYLAGNPQFHPLHGEAGGFGLNLSLAVHQPIRSGTDVEFEFSLQDRDGQIVPRPQAIWIDVTPVLANGVRGETYRFCDRNFKPGTSLPVLSWRAAQWPADAELAEVEFWCRFDQLEPDADVPIETVEKADAYQSSELPGPSEGTLTIERSAADPAELRVIEEYAAHGREFPACRIELSGAGLLSEVTRRYDARHHICLHQFRVKNESQWEHATIRITRRDRERIGAWQLPSPVRVEVVTADGLIVPAPP